MHMYTILCTHDVQMSVLCWRHVYTRAPSIQVGTCIDYKPRPISFATLTHIQFCAHMHMTYK